MEGNGCLHGGQTEKLEEVVLDHVLESPGGVEVAGPSLQSERLVPNDLDAFYIVVVPEWLQKAPCEAQAHDRRERLPGEEVVDAEHCTLGQRLVQQPVEHPGRFEILPEGFLDSDPATLRQICPFQGLDRWREDGWRQCQVGEDRLL